MNKTKSKLFCISTMQVLVHNSHKRHPLNWTWDSMIRTKVRCKIFPKRKIRSWTVMSSRSKVEPIQTRFKRCHWGRVKLFRQHRIVSHTTNPFLKTFLFKRWLKTLPALNKKTHFSLPKTTRLVTLKNSL